MKAIPPFTKEKLYSSSSAFPLQVKLETSMIIYNLGKKVVNLVMFSVQPEIKVADELYSASVSRLILPRDMSLGKCALMFFFS